MSTVVNQTATTRVEKRRASVKQSTAVLATAALPQNAETDRKRLWPDWQPPKFGVLSLLPAAWVPYAELMRIEKPGGLYAFYFPYLIGLFYAACIAPGIRPHQLATVAGKLLAWNVFLRGAACTVNDILDREYDRQVARCRTRPVARGAVTPAQGYVWYAAQTIVGAAIVSRLPNAWNCFLHAVFIQFIVSIYPLSKRVTDFPQIVLCIPLAWSIVMSSAALGVDPFAVREDTAITVATCLLVLGWAFWLVTFDYVNACQDTVDDIKAGVRSMAVRYQNTKAFIGLLGSAHLVCLLGAGLLAGLGPFYFVGACGGNAAILLAMRATATRDKPKNCAWWFSYGGMLLGATTGFGVFAEYVTSMIN